MYLEIYRRYLKPNGVVLDLFAGTAASALSLFQYKEPREPLKCSWYGCDIDKDLVNAAWNRLISRYMRYMEGI
jgi:ubiquinone/menaquinone biosynthesis C-methylase UbiE